MQIFVNTNFDFMKWRLPALLLSAVLIIAGIGAFFMRGVNLGIDFSGGASLILRFQQTVPMDALRAELGGVTIQRYGPAEDNSILIRLPRQETEGDQAGQAVQSINQSVNADLGGRLDLNFQGRVSVAELLMENDPDGRGTGLEAQAHYNRVAQNLIDRRSELGIFTSMDQVRTTAGLSPQASALLQEQAALGAFNVLSQETVGPAIGRELQRKASWAVILSTLAMGAYIAIRFDIAFGLAGITALVHDVAVTFGLLLLLGFELNVLTVAAFLMIVGYSINDTVVIYDRVRENRKKSPREDLATIINRSLNQTLSRTFLTGVTVWIVLLAIIIAGGQVLNQFAWLLLLGTLAGTYSTLTIVPAFVLAWERRRRGKPAKVRSRVNDESRNGARA